MNKLETLALRMARARRQRLDAQKFLAGYPVRRLPQHTDAKVADAVAKLRAARKDWKSATAALWRLVAKIDRGEA